MLVYPSRIGYSTLNNIFQRFSSLVFGGSVMSTSYIVKATPAGLEGLELVC